MKFIEEKQFIILKYIHICIEPLDLLIGEGDQRYICISPEYSFEGLMLKLKLQYFGLLVRGTDSLEKTLMKVGD